MSTASNTDALVDVLIALADDHLILGHRLSEWCGHAPMLEEDLSMPNMALDLLGQARNLYSFAGTLENAGRSEDDLAYLRSDGEYRNCLLVERDNTDFAHTMLRQFYFTAYMQPFWQQAGNSMDETIRGIAGKAVKETAYQFRHSGEWVIRLGDGTDESAARMQSAVDVLHAYTDELFAVSDSRRTCINAGLIPDSENLRDVWQQSIEQVFSDALLTIPDNTYPQTGGREGRHLESFGHLLAELQYLQRSYPGANW